MRAELARARSADRLHSAYLIEGPAGTGRRALAHWLGRLILCRTAGDAPCETCPDCRKTRPAAGESQGAARSGDAPSHPHPPSRHPDWTLIEPDGSTVKIAQVRALQAALSLVAHERGRRVATILEAQALNDQAANALLKTLEEPPLGTTLILVATQGESLPATILSRVSRIHLPPVSPSALAAALEAEGQTADAAWLAATLGGGSLPAARAWLAESLEAARAVHAEMTAAERALAIGTAGPALDLAESVRGGGEGGRDRTQLVLDVYDALCRERIRTAAARAEDAASTDALVRWLDRADASVDARREMGERNLNAQMVVEGLLLALVD
jgi:DNA polymerase-3 subunit delta'